MRPLVFFQSEVGGSSRTQGAQRSQPRAQTRIFSMTTDEAQANSNIMIGTMFVFSTPIRVLFDFGSSRSFFSITFALHVDWELAPLKNKLVVTTPLGEQILCTLIFKGCEILV